MDFQSIFNGLLLLLVAGVGAFLKMLKDDLRDIEKDLGSFRVDVARDYVTDERLDNTLRDIKHMLERIETKLDSKADRPR